MAVINYKAVRRSLKSLRSQVGSAMVGFIQSGTGAVVSDVQRKLRETVSVLDFIPKAEHDAIKDGTSTYDCTSAIVAAFAAHDCVDFGPEGWLFNVTTFNLAAGKSLVTRGRGPTFQQFPVTGFQRVIVVTGSNVTIGNCKGIGNIATDTDEQNHFIFIQANATYQTIENVLIGDIHGQDVRGDVIYFGQSSSSYSLKNVHIGHVTFDNVYRNGVSCVSCDGFSVKSVTGTRCGLFHMDVEANVGSGPCVNGWVGYVKGRHYGLVSQAAADYIDNVDTGILDLSPDHAAQSSPSNAGGAAIEDGLLLRNVRRASIGHLKAVGFNRCAIFTTYSSGELGCEMLKIGSLYMRDCALTDVTYSAYVVGADQTNLEVGYVDVVIAADSRAFSTVTGNIFGGVTDIQSLGIFLFDSDDVQIFNVRQTGAGGFFLQSCNRVSVKGGSFSGARLTASCEKTSFEDMVITTTTALYSANTVENEFKRCTVNGTYYEYLGGPGGAVTQATSKTTGVTLNTRNGQITMEATSAIAAGAVASFTLTNSKILANDIVDVQRKSGGTAGAYRVWCDSVAAGSCVICVENRTAGSLSETPVLQFIVRNGVIA